MDTSTERIYKIDTFSLPTMLEFKDIDLLSIPILRNYLEKFPSHSCDYSIGGILMWAQYFHYQYAIFRNTLFLKGFDNESNSFLYYASAGDMGPEEARRVVEDYARDTASFGLLIENQETNPDDYLIRLKGRSEYIDKWKEYLYPIERIAFMSGKKMEKKRNHLNYFRNNFPNAADEEINTGNAPALVEFTRRFMDKHEDPIFQYESEKTIEVLQNFDSYPFIGILLRDDKKIIGFSFGEVIGNTFFAHVEKGDIEYRGVYQALASTLCKKVMMIFPQVVYVNREEDMGDEALRRSKESYHPEVIVNKKISEVGLFS